MNGVKNFKTHSRQKQQNIQDKIMITVFKQPLTLHSASNINYWSFLSDFRFAPRFNIRANIIDGNTSALLNSLLLPTNPQNYSVFDAGGIMGDWVSSDPKPFITAASASNQSRSYKVELSESFEGFYIYGTSSAGTIQNVDVVNNSTVQIIGTPSSVLDIGFVGGNVTTATGDIFVINYGTASNGYINRFELSRSSTQSIAVTASVGVSYGYVVLNNVSVFSIGATAATSTKTAIKANIDYLDWTQDNDFGAWTLNSPASQFLTNLKEQPISFGEWSTLGFIQGTTASSFEITYSTGATASYSISNTSKRIDIASGTKNLNITGTYSSYTLRVKDAAGNYISEPIKYNIVPSSGRDCSTSDNPLVSNIRLVWLNDLGGWDFFTFKYVEQKNRTITRDTFDKNLNWLSTKRDRTHTAYRVQDWQEWSLVSDLQPDDISYGISSLFTSNDAYLIYKDGLIPIQITTDTHIVSSGWDDNEIRVSFRLSRSNDK